MKILRGEFTKNGLVLTWKLQSETLTLEPWGRNGVRVRSTANAYRKELPGALLDAKPSQDAALEIGPDAAVLTNGKIRVELDIEGRLRFLKRDGSRVFLEEPVTEILLPRGREFKALGSDLHKLEVRFLSDPSEKIFGLGQHRHGRLNQKGCVLDLTHRNCEISIPFALSNRGYGFLWHNPGTGRVEFAENHTRWVADASAGIDYWITAGDSPAEIMAGYAEATGHSPMLPDWASGFWQSKLRYKSQDELLRVAHEYKARGLPLSVIVIDFFHWEMMGDMGFDAAAWPDPAGLVKELESIGVKVMISVWPSFNGNSRSYEEFSRKGWVLGTERGTPALFPFFDTQPEGLVYLHHYDPTHPEARKAFWKMAKEAYLEKGIRIFWLDACEPEISPIDYDNLRFHLGNGREVAGLYPFLHAQAFAEGMAEAGEKEPFFLCRSAWAGSQRFGAAVWSGDIKSTFEVLTAQVRAGLNMAVSGIPWWTTDIGGFHSGDPSTGYFRELIVRWFQYGVFCPLFRLHGVRLPAEDKCGSDNEVWSFGDEAYALINPLMHLRERLRPYIQEQMATAHREGTPPMRPLFMEFPNDPHAWNIEDQFLLGPDILIAPVTSLGMRERAVYLPAGARWMDAWTGTEHNGGSTHLSAAPLDKIPVFLRKSDLRPLFQNPS